MSDSTEQTNKTEAVASEKKTTTRTTKTTTKTKATSVATQPEVSDKELAKEPEPQENKYLLQKKLRTNTQTIGIFFETELLKKYPALVKKGDNYCDCDRNQNGYTAFPVS